MSESATFIAGKILDVISDSATVNDFITDNFPGDTLHLYLGVDVQDLPDEASTPWFALIPRSVGLSDDYNHREISILATLSIKKDGKTSTGKYTRMDGFDPICKLSERIQNAVDEALDHNVMTLSSISLETDYPYYRASWTFTVPTEE